MASSRICWCNCAVYIVSVCGTENVNTIYSVYRPTNLKTISFVPQTAIRAIKRNRKEKRWSIYIFSVSTYIQFSPNSSQTKIITARPKRSLSNLMVKLTSFVFAVWRDNSHQPRPSQPRLCGRVWDPIGCVDTHKSLDARIYYIYSSRAKVMCVHISLLPPMSARKSSHTNRYKVPKINWVRLYTIGRPGGLGVVRVLAARINRVPYSPHTCVTRGVNSFILRARAAQIVVGYLDETICAHIMCLLSLCGSVEGREAII